MPDIDNELVPLADRPKVEAPAAVDWRSIAARIVLGTGYDVDFRKLNTTERDEVEQAVDEARTAQEIAEDAAIERGNG